MTCILIFNDFLMCMFISVTF